MMPKEQFLERERRWALLAGIASVAGVALIIASLALPATNLSGASGVADQLLTVDAHRSTLVISSIVQAFGWMLLVIPLVYLFKAVSARSPQVRRGLIGVIIVAPIFLGLGTLVSASSVLDAATEFKKVPASQIETCIGEKQDEAAANPGSDVAQLTDIERTTECRDSEARNLRTSTPLFGLEIGLGLAGLLGFAIAVVYCALWGLRTGLLTRFWGSLGIALGVVSIVPDPRLLPVRLIWFIYLGLLFAGWVPGGRPPAWASGEAMPWPKGRGGFGDRGGPADDPDGDGAVLEGHGEPVEDGTEPITAPEPEEAPQIERRKRKKRGG